MRCCQDGKQQQEEQQQRHQRNLLDPRVQEMIAEEIRQKNVEANRAAAAEFTPEMFAKVTMLFIPVRINGHLGIYFLSLSLALARARVLTRLRF